MAFKLLQHKNFIHTLNGKNTHLIVLKNRSGMQVAFTDYGARIVSILVPDKNGELRDVILGFGSIGEYLDAKEKFHGATIGRFANRIANGKFSLNDQFYTLPQNNGTNCLHGGLSGFHDKVWDRQVSFKKKVDFYLSSPDGDEGFPGNLRVNVSFELNEDNEILIKYRAICDKDTILNLTNHAYFNLNGEGNGDVLNHQLTIPSTHFIPINENQIPLGQEAPVEETPFDFRNTKSIGKHINNDDVQLAYGNGYDHTFVNSQPFTQVAASAYSPESGIRLEVKTTEPGIQLYTGNFLSEKDKGKSGENYGPRGAFCLETQHYPNSPNEPRFPSVVLKADTSFTSQTSFRFSVNK
ncbi:galactose mutarotase [Sphingobacterium shayense]|uniref:aldose epimerase family protein n=1 Tax=Sphingobacterium shayense TaxID=626343 RepID=UPI0015536808|nr:aldose epimerase family protein [Sphingobacterium shayense]NQD71662.1 galactose mutarotase [Sphingobacterium shayense]